MRKRNEIKGIVVALNAPKKIRDFIIFARAVHDGMDGNPHFPSPNVTLLVFAKNIADLEVAETKVETGGKGAVAARDAKMKTVKENLSSYQHYVQTIVQTNTDPAAATAMVESAFMSVKKTARRAVPEVSAKNADVSGKVVLAAKAVSDVAMYYWEHSLDQATWTPVPETMVARTELSGLSSARTYYFRFRAQTRAGKGDYSQVVSLLVH